MAFVGSSTKLDSAIRALHQPCAVSTYPDQAHHLLSSNVIIKLENEYADLAAKATYDLNRASNGILLPTNFGHQMIDRLPRHCGNHWKAYYTNVEARVRPNYEKYKATDPCTDPIAKKNILDALKSAEDDARLNIKNLSWPLYAWSKSLYDGDYRDEGTGNLYLNRPPDVSDTAGEAWLKDKAGTIKRRYTKQQRASGTANIVKKKWYTDHGYPVPGSIY